MQKTRTGLNKGDCQTSSQFRLNLRSLGKVSDRALG